MRAAKVQASLRIRAVSPEPPLLAHTRSESRGTFRQEARSLAPLNDWACAVKICHDGMLEDTNSLDAPHLIVVLFQDLELEEVKHYKRPRVPIKRTEVAYLRACSICGITPSQNYAKQTVTSRAILMSNCCLSHLTIKPIAISLVVSPSWSPLLLIAIEFCNWIQTAKPVALWLIFSG